MKLSYVIDNRTYRMADLLRKILEQRTGPLDSARDRQSLDVAAALPPGGFVEGAVGVSQGVGELAGAEDPLPDGLEEVGFGLHKKAEAALRRPRTPLQRDGGDVGRNWHFAARQSISTGGGRAKRTGRAARVAGRVTARVTARVV